MDFPHLRCQRHGPEDDGIGTKGEVRAGGWGVRRSGDSREGLKVERQHCRRALLWLVAEEPRATIIIIMRRETRRRLLSQRAQRVNILQMRGQISALPGFRGDLKRHTRNAAPFRGPPYLTKTTTTASDPSELGSDFTCKLTQFNPGPEGW